MSTPAKRRCLASRIAKRRTEGKCAMRRRLERDGLHAHTSSLSRVHTRAADDSAGAFPAHSASPVGVARATHA